MKKTLVKVSLIVLITSNAQASLINTYKLHSEATYVTNDDNTLRWKRFDTTVGMSINEALAANPGWRLASNEEFSKLMDDAGNKHPTTYIFSKQIKGERYTYENYCRSDVEPEYPTGCRSFDGFDSADANLMGAKTFRYDYDNSGGSYKSRFKIFFGNDTDGDGFHNYFASSTGYDAWSSQHYSYRGYEYGINNISKDEKSGNYMVPLYGSVALVQDVPVPAAAWLFGSALLGLVGFRKIK